MCNTDTESLAHAPESEVSLGLLCPLGECVCPPEVYMGLIWAKGEAGASLLATCDAEKSREAFRFAPNKEGGSGGVGGWQADAGVCVCMYVCV